jgi:hypothetical protein
MLKRGTAIRRCRKRQLDILSQTEWPRSTQSIVRSVPDRPCSHYLFVRFPANRCRLPSRASRHQRRLDLPSRCRPTRLNRSIRQTHRVVKICGSAGASPCQIDDPARRSLALPITRSCVSSVYFRRRARRFHCGQSLDHFIRVARPLWYHP